MTPWSTRGDVLVIRVNHCNAGFFAQVQFALNQLRYAEQHGMIPVVEFGRDSVDGPNAYFEEEAGPNVWEYYFEPIDGLTPVAARERARRSGRRVLTLKYWELWRLHWKDPGSVFTYPYGYYRDVENKTQSFDAEWWEAQRREGRRVVARYLRVRPEIVSKVDRFVAEHFRGPMLGVHARGTDKSDTGTSAALSRVVPPSEYFPHIDEYLAAHPNARIFFATDQHQFREEMHARYPDRLVTYANMLSTSNVNVFQMLEPAGRGHRLKGEEVLIDALLLSRCDFLLKCTSAVGEFAQYFAPSLPSLDLNFSDLPPRPPESVRSRLLLALHRAKGRTTTLAERAWYAFFKQGLEDAAQPSRPERIFDTNRFQPS